MEFSIKSTSSTQELTLSNRDGEYFEARLTGIVAAHVRVYAYTDEQGLSKLFQELGAMEKPWEGNLSWESLESEFKLSVSCSSLGEVQFNISLWCLPGHPEEWRVNLGLVSELGQLQSISNQAKRFFS